MERRLIEQLYFIRCSTEDVGFHPLEVDPRYRIILKF